MALIEHWDYPLYQKIFSLLKIITLKLWLYHNRRKKCGMRSTLLKGFSCWSTTDLKQAENWPTGQASSLLIAFYSFYMHTNNELISLTNSHFDTAPYETVTSNCFRVIYTMNKSFFLKSVTSGLQSAKIPCPGLWPVHRKRGDQNIWFFICSLGPSWSYLYSMKNKISFFECIPLPNSRAPSA